MVTRNDEKPAYENMLAFLFTAQDIFTNKVCIPFWVNTHHSLTYLDRLKEYASFIKRMMLILSALANEFITAFVHDSSALSEHL
ncbi:hypothetical protein THO17_13230 [Marinomonas sp. THO17]